MTHFLSISQVQGFHKDSTLKFSDEELSEFYLITDMNGEPVREIKIDPASNVAGNIQSDTLPGALFFYPDKEKHPKVLFAVYHEDGHCPDLSQPEQVFISIILHDPAPLGHLMCPGCCHTGDFKAEIFGRGIVNEYGVLQDVDVDDCAIDSYSKVYYCEHCRMTGHHGLFDFRQFIKIDLTSV